MRRKIARKLRNLADRVDPSSGPRGIGAYFNIVPGRGLVITQTDGVRVNPPVPGVPLWYMAEDYDRAWWPGPVFDEPIGRVVDVTTDEHGLRIRWEHDCSGSFEIWTQSGSDPEGYVCVCGRQITATAGQGGERRL